MAPVDRAFLLEEIDNVERCLNESLRHDYGTDHGAGFFEECRQRLEALRLVADSTSNLGGLQSLASQTIDLANLISRIERSHRGEISWAFAERIAALAQLVCTDRSGSDSTRNLFYFGSEGGLDNYAVYPEQSEAKLFSARIFSVIFPRTLRHHVLLHPILGHELGHAARAIPAIDNYISNVITTLSDESPLDDPSQFKNWLTQHLPSDTDLDNLPDSWFEEVSRNWLDELFCDLFGLLIFGPSFIGAHCTLLCTVDPLGPSWDTEHPPVTCRLRLIVAAARHLGWLTYCDDLGRPFAVDSRELWPHLYLDKLTLPWAEVVKDQMVEEAIDLLRHPNSGFLEAFYSPIDHQIIGNLSEQVLNRVPPVRLQIYSGESIPLVPSDFRDIILAGWLSWARASKANATNTLTFLQINRLCEHAILQDLAIARQSEHVAHANPGA